MELRQDKCHDIEYFIGGASNMENVYQEIADVRFGPQSALDAYAIDERIYHEPHQPGVFGPHPPGDPLYSVCNINPQSNPIHSQEYSTSRPHGHSKNLKRQFEPGKCPTAVAPDGGAVRCEHCTYALLDFKRQLMQVMGSDPRIAKVHALPPRVEEGLHVAENLRRVATHGARCAVCKSSVTQLKHEAFVIVKAIQTSGQSGQGAALQMRSTQELPGSPPGSHRPSRGPTLRHAATQPTLPFTVQSQEQIEQKPRVWSSNPKKLPQASRPSPGGPSAADRSHFFNEALPLTEHRGSPVCHTRVSSTPSSPYNAPRGTTVNAATSPMAQPSASSSFFARAAQKLSMASKKKKKSHMEMQLPVFATCYCDVIRHNPPPAPPYLLRSAGRMQNPGIGKVKVMVRIVSPPNGTLGEHGSATLSVDARKKQITLYDPSASGYVSAAQRRTGVAAPKTFAFDAVFPQDDSLTEISASSLTDIIQGVVGGADGCVFSFGYPRTSKSHTMFGKDQSAQTLGLIPCAISWLFRLIDQHRTTTGARFSVRVSAVEVSGKQESLRDLLADIAQVGTETGVATAPGVYLREDPICGTQLENQSELRAPTADQAAYYLDAAIAARATSDDEDLRHSHLLFTLHVYQYRVEKANKSGLPGVAGGRSRLHFIDLGSCSKSKDPNNVSLSLSALGNVILALLNGQRHIPHRDAKIARLLKDSLGNVSCRTCMIAHVSATLTHYSETLQVIQLASRIHRLRRRKLKFSSPSSDDSSTDDSGRLRRPLRGFRMGTLRENFLYSSSLSDPDCTSGSEHSCETVIDTGLYGPQSLSDLEFTDNEASPKSLPLLPRTNPRLPRRTSGSRSSGDEGSASDTGRKFSPVGDAARVSVSKMHYSREPCHQSRAPAMSPVSTPNSSLDCGSPTLGPVSPGYQVARRTNIKQRAPSKFKPESGANGRHQTNNESSEFLEQWIDGPRAAGFPDRKNTELWVDGPQAFMVRTGKQSRSAKENDEEFRGRVWVAKRQNGNFSDGDTQSLQNGTMDSCELECWIDGPNGGDPRLMGANRGKPHGVASRKKCPSQINQPSTSNRKSPERDDDARPSQVLAIPIEAKVTRPGGPHEGSRPESAASGDSLNAEPSDSRPASFHSNVQSEIGDDVLTKGVGNGGGAHLGDFITKWDQDNDPNLGFIVDSSNEVIRSLEGFSNSSPPQGSATINNIQPPPGGIEPEPLTEALNCVSVNAHMTRRVAEWLKTVETVEAQMKPGPPNSSPKSESLDLIDAKALGKEIDRVWFTDDEVKAVDVAKNNPEMELANLMISNRESMYEIRADQLLEVADEGNDTFSTVSFPKDPECLAIAEEEERIITVQKLKALNAVQSEQPTLKKDPRAHCQYEGSKLSDLEEVSEEESVLECKFLPCRNPDGGPEPALSKEIFHEDGGAFDVSVIKQNYTINPTSSIYITSSSKQLLSEKNSLSGYSLISPYVDNMGSNFTGSRVPLYSVNNTAPPSPSPLQKPLIKTNSKSKEADAFVSSAKGQSKHCGILAAFSPTKQGFQEGPSKKIGLGYIHQGPASLTSSPMVQDKMQVSSASLIKSSGRNHGSCQTTPSSPAIQAKQCKGSTVSLTSSGHSSRGRGAKSPTVVTPSTGGAPRNRSGSKSQSPNRSKLPSFNATGLCQLTKLRRKDKGYAEKTTPSKPHEGEGNGWRKSPETGTENTETSSKPHEAERNGWRKSPETGIVNTEKTAPSEVQEESTEWVKNAGVQVTVGKIIGGEDPILSPYATVTKPREVRHSSSGHCSDNSSSVSAEMRAQMGGRSDKAHGGGTSSGYESMLRDSEATGSSSSSSSHEDSASEGSSGDQKKGTRKKKTPGSRRSRSAPGRSTSGSPLCGIKGDPHAQYIPPSPSSKAWVDTRQIHKLRDEPLEIRTYNSEDVERMHRRRKDELEVYEQRRERALELLNKQEGLKQELNSAKDRLLIEHAPWNFDCEPGEDIDYSKAGEIQVLEYETSALERRVRAAQSRLMIVTSFDVVIRSATGHRASNMVVDSGSACWEDVCNGFEVI